MPPKLRDVPMHLFTCKTFPQLHLRGVLTLDLHLSRLGGIPMLLFTCFIGKPMYIYTSTSCTTRGPFFGVLNPHIISPPPRRTRHSCLLLKNFFDVDSSLQPACALILSTNGKVLHGCAWVTKKCVYAWPCNWPYTHA